jgi:large subunit ribosomal protein L4e
MATALATASILSTEGKSTGSVPLPDVFKAPLRADVVRTVFVGMSKNKRQAHGVKYESGYDTAAISWGTGRAVARIPRVPGGGTHRAGQGAFGNMCRGGGMFNPLKTWRKWHRKVNVTAKRHALAASIAASAVAPLVMARGHEIMEVPEVPLVVDDAAEDIATTKEAIALFKAIGLESELTKSDASKKVRAGRGKMRNRRYVMRKGPLFVYSKSDASIAKAARNIPGVELCSVERLNLLQLAPGGTFGRLCVWSKSSVERLGALYGSYATGSAVKKGYTLPRPLMVNTDIARIINSDEVQSVLNPAKMTPQAPRQRKNPLKNRNVLSRLCPGELRQKKVRALAHVKDSVVAKKIAALKVKKSEKAKKVKGQSKKFYKELQGAHPVVTGKKEVVAEEEEDEE